MKIQQKRLAPERACLRCSLLAVGCSLAASAFPSPPLEERENLSRVAVSSGCCRAYQTAGRFG